MGRPLLVAGATAFTQLWLTSVVAAPALTAWPILGTIALTSLGVGALEARHERSARRVVGDDLPSWWFEHAESCDVEGCSLCWVAERYTPKPKPLPPVRDPGPSIAPPKTAVEHQERVARAEAETREYVLDLRASGHVSAEEARRSLDDGQHREWDEVPVAKNAGPLVATSYMRCPCGRCARPTTYRVGDVLGRCHSCDPQDDDDVVLIKSGDGTVIRTTRTASRRAVSDEEARKIALRWRENGNTGPR